MKIVYVLVSSEKDYYTEQSLVSMYSLKRHNPDLEINLIIDDDSLKVLKHNRKTILDIADKVVPTETPAYLSNKSKSRFLKTSIFRYIKGDFLYIDNDTVVTGPLKELEHADIKIAVAGDKNNIFAPNRFMDKFFSPEEITFNKKHGYYNAGVIFAKDTPESFKFFNDWHNIWLRDLKSKNIEIDQVAFMEATKLNITAVKELDGRYNCQIIFPDSKKHLLDAKIVHYINDYKEAPVSSFRNPVFWKKFRETGFTEENLKIIENPIQDYLNHCEIISQNDAEFYSSPFFIVCKKIYTSFPSSNKIAKWLLKLKGYKV